MIKHPFRRGPSALIVSAWAVAGLAQAQQWQPDPTAIYDIHSEAGRLDETACTATLSGNVSITQGRARLLAKAGTIQRGRSGGKCEAATRIDLDGEVFYVTPDGRVRADKVVYDVVKSMMAFTGDVVVVQGDNVSNSGRVTLNLKDDSILMDGGFRALITPAKAAN